MEWRDVAMGLMGVVITFIGLLYRDIKEALTRTVDKDHYTEHHDEHNRRLNIHDTSIGELYSKLHDGDVDRVKLQLEFAKTLNEHHLAFVSALRDFLTEVRAIPKQNSK